MAQNRQQNKQSQLKNYRFYLGSRERYITISSHFDSGNIKVTKQLTEFQYRLECVEDGTYTSKQVNSKTWFYFQAKGFPKNTKGKFIVSKVQALSSIFYSKYSKSYRPVYRTNGGSWTRFSSEVPLSLRENGDLQCTIEYTFKDEDQVVEFAFCYPYQFSQHMLYLQSLDHLQNDEELYFHKEILIQSLEKRPIHLITITSQDEADKDKEKQEIFNQFLFPEKIRPKRYKKPVVLLTARVHPGQTPASYTMQGVINFLIDKQDLRAHMLRKMFVFMIVPMINVDGVYHGHFRMDTQGKNLNRFYISPNKDQQPAIFAIKQLASHLIAQNRLSFYFDLHGHNAKKGCFIYGNAFNDFVQQVESQVFCKLFAMNHTGFEYQYCNFSQKHMNAKDRFEDLTKQGCGRVVMYKTANIIHSYSVQCGIISPNHANIMPEPINRDFKIGTKGFVTDSIEQDGYEGERLSDNSILFTEDSYRNLGKNLLVSILDVFDKNPYNRVYNSRYKSMQMLRRLTAFEIFHSAQRFRMFERFIFGKVKNINLLIQEILNSKIHYKQLYNCYFNDDAQLDDVEWPKNILGLVKIGKTQGSKLRRFKSVCEGKLTNIEDDEIIHNGFKSSKAVKEQKQPKEETLFVENQKQIAPSDASIKDGQENNNENDSIHMDRTDTIEIATSQDIPQNNTQQLEIEIIEDNSDGSEIEEAEMNQQILLMCENQKEQNEILSKIMLNNFDQKDIEKIEEKYKHKNTLDDEAVQKNSILSYSHTDNTTKKYTKPDILKDFSSTKQHKYRLSKKIIAVNTQDINHRHKSKKLQILNSDHNPASIQYRDQIIQIKKMTAAEEFRRNIYDSIKQQIKEGLRRQYERKKQKEKMDHKLIDSFRLKSNNNRGRAFHNFTDSKRIKSKVKLPSLGANMYIITTSTRLIHKT